MDDMTEFCYLYKGELYSTSKDSIHKNTRELDARELYESNSPRAFFWKGTDKAYTDLY